MSHYLHHFLKNTARTESFQGNSKTAASSLGVEPKPRKCQQSLVARQARDGCGCLAGRRVTWWMRTTPACPLQSAWAQHPRQPCPVARLCFLRGPSEHLHLLLLSHTAKTASGRTVNSGRQAEQEDHKCPRKRSQKVGRESKRAESQEENVLEQGVSILTV